MNPAHQRLASAGAALAWAGVLLYFTISGRINFYLVPGFRTYALIGGLGLAMLGLFVLLTHRTQASCGHDHAPGESHDHDSPDMPAWGILASMVLPIMATAWLTTDAFSMRALEHKGAFSQPTKLVAPPPGSMPTRAQMEAGKRTENGSVIVDLLEIYFSSMDPEYAAVMEGLDVAVEARVAKRDGTRIAYRLLLTCCAADGRPLSLQLDIPAALDTLPENPWALIEGKLSYRKDPSGHLVPVIAVTRIQEKKAPSEEYLLRF